MLRGGRWHQLGAEGFELAEVDCAIAWEETSRGLRPAAGDAAPRLSTRV
jgi:hypothetical protein